MELITYCAHKIQMYKTAVYTRVNGVTQKVTQLRQQKSRTTILLKQHLANVNDMRL